MNKRFLFAAILILVIGSIWYLESMKAHPGAGSGGESQAIGVTAQTASSGVQETAVSLSAIASADQNAGYPSAMEIADPTGFVNATSGFRLSDFVGKKVVLLDFWTYSCINCIRTLPYLTSWYQKYKDQGLVIVGVHTPEFDFEKNIANVQAAAQEYGITYPVVLDSNYGTWNAYGNLYWPHEYLIDIAGYIVHDHVGEGGYAETEGIIQQLLAQREQALGLSAAVSSGTVSVAPADLSEIQSPETYFGSNRNTSLANGVAQAGGVQTLSMPAPQNLSLNQLYLGGKWDFSPEYATAESAGSEVAFKYDAGKVYIVASAAASTTVEVVQDGQPVSAADAGSDVHDGKLVVGASRLYSIINNAGGGGVHTIELIVDSPGLQAFTFTFG